MEATTDAGTAGSEQMTIPVVTVPGDESLSVTAAARALANLRHKGRDEEQQPAGEQREHNAQPPAAEGFG